MTGSLRRSHGVPNGTPPITYVNLNQGGVWLTSEHQAPRFPPFPMQDQLSMPGARSFAEVDGAMSFASGSSHAVDGVGFAFTAMAGPIGVGQSQDFMLSAHTAVKISGFAEVEAETTVGAIAGNGNLLASEFGDASVNFMLSKQGVPWGSEGATINAAVSASATYTSQWVQDSTGTWKQVYGGQHKQSQGMLSVMMRNDSDSDLGLGVSIGAYVTGHSPFAAAPVPELPMWSMMMVGVVALRLLRRDIRR